MTVALDVHGAWLEELDCFWLEELEVLPRADGLVGWPEEIEALPLDDEGTDAWLEEDVGRPEDGEEVNGPALEELAEDDFVGELETVPMLDDVMSLPEEVETLPLDVPVPDGRLEVPSVETETVVVVILTDELEELEAGSERVDELELDIERVDEPSACTGFEELDEVVPWLLADPGRLDEDVFTVLLELVADEVEPGFDFDQELAVDEFPDELDDFIELGEIVGFVDTLDWLGIEEELVDGLPDVEEIVIVFVVTVMLLWDAIDDED